MITKKSTHRKQQSLATHKKIYDTAIALFYKKGYEGVTISEICRKSGVSLGTFYIHFKSKDQVIMECFMAINKFVEDEVVPELLKMDNQFDKLKFSFHAVFQYVDSLGKDLMRVALQSQITAGKKLPAMAADKGALFETLYAIVDDSLKEGIINSKFNSLDTTRFILMTFRGVLYEWCLRDGKFDLATEGEKAAQIILNGLLAKPTTY